MVIHCDRCNAVMNHLNGLKGHGHGICDACLTIDNQTPLGEVDDCYFKRGMLDLVTSIFDPTIPPDGRKKTYEFIPIGDTWWNVTAKVAHRDEESLIKEWVASLPKIFLP